MPMVGPRYPLRGEIWWVHLPTDPPDKGRRPVVIVSTDSRNRHERASTVLAIPLTTSTHKLSPADLLLKSGEAGLAADSAAQAGNVTVIVRANLQAPASGQRALSNFTVCKLASLVRIAMGCPT